MGHGVDVLVHDRFAEFRELGLSCGTLVETTSALSREPGSKARLLQRSTSNRSMQSVAFKSPRSSSPTKTATFMREFFDDINDIRETLQEGRRAVSIMLGLVDEALHATTKDRQDVIHRRLAQLVEDITRSVTQSKHDLEDLKVQPSGSKGSKSSPAELKIRSNMQQAMVRKHQQLVSQFQDAQIEYKRILERQEVRDLQLICPSATEEEVRDMIDAGQNSTQIVMRKMAGAHAMILDEVQRIQDKHRDILRLETSVRELAQMMQEMAVLVDAQGEMLDSIEIHVHKASEYAGNAVKELQTTTKIQRNTRKWTCWLICLLLIVLSIILGPILVSNALS